MIHKSNLFLKGLKTGMYYLRTKPAAQAIQFTVDKKKLAETKMVNGGSGDHVIPFFSFYLKVTKLFKKIFKRIEF